MTPDHPAEGTRFMQGCVVALCLLACIILAIVGGAWALFGGGW